MRWVRVLHEQRVRLGVWKDDVIYDLTAVADQAPPAWVMALQQADLRRLLDAPPVPVEQQEALLRQAPQLSPSAVTFLAPIPNPPKNIMCIGHNYVEHAQESAQFQRQQFELPQHPIIFTKPHTCINDPEAPIRHPRHVTQELDYEGEVAVVIGRGGRDIPKERAWDHVFGLTLLNDVTARDLQRRHKQFFKGKGLDTSAPMGPSVVTLDDIPDVEALTLETYVNGERRQSARLSQLIFDIPTLIAVISAGMTLEPGDIISTGTPEGVGAGMQPPRFLQPGDVVEIVCEPIGRLRNPVVADERPEADGAA